MHRNLKDSANTYHNPPSSWTMRVQINLVFFLHLFRKRTPWTNRFLSARYHQSIEKRAIAAFFSLRVSEYILICIVVTDPLQLTTSSPMTEHSDSTLSLTCPQLTKTADLPIDEMFRTRLKMFVIESQDPEDYNSITPQQ